MKKKTKFAVSKFRLLPLYWKIVGSIVIFFGGGGMGTYLFTSASDVEMVAGFIVLAVSLWLLINFWLPADSTDAPADCTDDSADSDDDPDNSADDPTDK